MIIINIFAASTFILWKTQKGSITNEVGVHKTQKGSITKEVGVHKTQKGSITNEAGVHKTQKGSIAKEVGVHKTYNKTYQRCCIHLLNFNSILQAKHMA